ncbi:hypothetical protein UFOVP19_40 [uncultured Caudovirales phage]|uniref:Uncharacterized protein n=1 Tax=uncultured Caudovirales phage TaxID=2100421 RepID=A0A6J5KK36_9CAUD|nr:hypothetical protein UFOVP19_40 [uncultured Caudovirales phage]
MRILAITSKFSGVGYHRIMMPLVNMQKDYCMITDTINEAVFDNNYDIVVFNRFISFTEIDTLERMRNKYKFKLVVDNDDYWDLPPSHILYQRYKEVMVGKMIIDFIRVADLCTCTHERLADEISVYNKNVEILPNAVPYGKEQFQDNKIESDLVRLFWSGSGTHQKDMDILRNPMKRINFPIKTVIAGYNLGEKHIWDAMIAVFTNGLKLNPTIYDYADTTRYMGAYADSDISLIPLENNKFNSMKSNLKVLETASKKNPAIVSNVHPYKNMPLCYVDNQKDWYYWIKLLTYDEAARFEYGQKLYEFCNREFNFEAINKKRFAIYNKLIGNANI